MAAVAPPTDQAAELLQKLSLDSQTKTIEIPDAAKKPAIDSNNAANGIQSDRSITPILTDFMDPSVCYLPNGYPSTAYYFSGYDGSANEWEDYGRYVNQDGVEMTPGVYGDNGSLVYHHGYGYTPYAPYSPAASPVPTMGHDGQLYGAQHYQYPTPYFQPPTSGPYSTPAAPAKGEIATSAAADQVPLSVDSTNSKSNGIANSGGTKGNNGTAPTRATFQNSSFNVNGSYPRGALPGGIPASGYQDPRFGFDNLHSPISWLETPYFSDGQPRAVTSSSMASSIASGNNVPSSRNQNFRPHLMGLHHPRPMSGMNSANGYINRMYPNKLYGQYGHAYRSGLGYGSTGYDTRATGRGWVAVDSKYKTRGRGNGLYYGNEGMDGLNELNRGPRAKSSKNQKGFTPVALAVKGQNIPLAGATDNEEKKSSMTPDREQYNRPDFPDTYADAKFFIIKSYSEDDVHKSIKYNVWASTPNGNKKLDAAHLDAQQRSGGCPVFLFFSVNTSGQFVGVAEMTGPVDFNKNVEYWQQDKWIGCFPVKWHIVKDVPNSLLKHITLENNENKPVTNSRDTQEVKLEQGLQMLKIFKEHTSKQCILDDFDFYEDRQRRIQEKKAKQQQFQRQAQVWEGKPTDEKNKENQERISYGDLKSQKPSEPASDLNAEPTSDVKSNGDSTTAENSAISKSGDVLKTVKPAVQEKKIVANGVVNGC
ncbi:putative high-glucose-regulated protein [Handroanthus impetiginosus]|uniref:YTH domain-containing family protein n=1 Tax=Handroanthus impetiginosus TaxID=429701 RepID=A0A2G9GJW1_9LAMI|nr:putative high-glucose-regulated protein [Handroanthus impetiginosus]